MTKFEISMAICGSTQRWPSGGRMLDWALHWQAKGLNLFPCRKFLGDPLIDDWYAEGAKGASNSQAKIIAWWSHWPDADIGAVPQKSGHYAIVAVESEGGAESLDQVRTELPGEFGFQHRAPWGEHHLWFHLPDRIVHSSQHRLGRGLHIVGAGQYVHLPNSRAPFGA